MIPFCLQGLLIGEKNAEERTLNVLGKAEVTDRRIKPGGNLISNPFKANTS